METGIGPPTQEDLAIVEAARKAAEAEIKKERGESDMSVTDTRGYAPYPPVLSKNLGEGQNMFASFTDNSLGSEQLSLPVHFQQQLSSDGPHQPPSAAPPQEETGSGSSGSQTAGGRGQGLASLASVSSGGHSVTEDAGLGGELTGTPNSQNHGKEPAAVVEQFEQSNSKPPAKQVSRAAAERVEKTTRRLRNRQSTAARHDIPNQQTDTPNEPASEKPLVVQETEMLPPASKELRPRRMTRKPCHTQRVWRPDISGKPFDKWRGIGQTQGLSNDTEIAVFLMEHYENVLSGQPTGAVCVTCNAPLTFSCPVCHATSPSLDTSKSTLNSHSDGSTSISATAARVENNNGVLETKLEPEEALSDGLPEPFEVEPEQEEEEEEEEEKKKRKTGKRKRGRPVGSGKKQTDSGTAKVNSKIRKYKCTYDGCDAAFTKSSRLKIHNRIHTGEKPYVCKECNRAFTQNSGLKVHMQKHTGLRPFSCKECSAAFPSSSTLKQHMRRHTGEKPFKCKKCDQTFRWSGHLTQHMRNHEGIKPFLCQDCGKSFSASSDLVKHKVTHTKDRPYKCKECDKAYAFQHRLTAHMRSHTGDRPFLCSDCGSAFARAHNLTVHQRTHTGVKPYWCKECDAKFSDSGNFSKHKKTKHGVAAKNAFDAKMTDLAKETKPNNDSDSAGAAGLARLQELGGIPDMAKMAEFARRKMGRLPSMARVAGVSKMMTDPRYLPVSSLDPSASPSHPHSLPPVSTVSPHPRPSPPSDMADLKSLLPPMGGEQSFSAIPPHLSGAMQVGSPPALPVQNRMSASPAMSVPSQSSPGPSASNDSCISPMPQPAHQVQDYRVPQHDEVVFPHHYYNSYPYYYQQ